MKLIHTHDGGHYRRWINLIPSLILPGSAHFLSGRKTAGIAWFLFYLLIVALLMGFLVHPKTTYSLVHTGPYDWVIIPLWLIIAGDGLRRPIPRIGLRGWILFLCIYGGLSILPILVIRTYLVQPFNIPSMAMAPTIQGKRQDAAGNRIVGDHIFVNKLVYRFSQPERGDVVVFKTDGIKSQFVQQGAYYVKRITGLPGDTISIDPPYVAANGNRLTEPAIFRQIAESQFGYKGYCLADSNSANTAYLTSLSARITLGPDEYLVMGDNGQNSLDGRYFGPIKRTAIIGKAFYIYAPADRKRKIE